MSYCEVTACLAITCFNSKSTVKRVKQNKASGNKKIACTS